MHFLLPLISVVLVHAEVEILLLISMSVSEFILITDTSLGTKKNEIPNESHFICMAATVI